MSKNDFYDMFIKGELDQFVSLRFEKICEQYLIRKYKQRNQEPIMNIGRYWYNNRKQKTDIEIDLCVQTKEYIHIYECKWTNNMIGESIMNELIENGKHIGATKYGAISKNGYHENVLNRDFDLIEIEDFFV